jgi:hypothetical protein
MPTDRHTATGTCEIGRAAHNRIARALQVKSKVGRDFFLPGRVGPALIWWWAHKMSNKRLRRMPYAKVRAKTPL